VRVDEVEDDLPKALERLSTVIAGAA
jgi:hypothetical protein